MKTTVKLFATFAAALLSFSLVSCDESGDTTKPTIELSGPAEGKELTANNDVHFKAELSDDVALGSYKIDIHPNFDDHSHSRSGDSSTEDFSYNNTWDDIAGQRNASLHHHKIFIPANATLGDYHFILYCVDAAGNEAYVVHNIKIIAATAEPTETK